LREDDLKQSPLATRLVESRSVESRGFVSLVSVVELFWVMSSAYELDRGQLIAALEGLLAIYDDQQTYMAGLTQFILDVDANRF
jgi:predicted nucleic-acid-binding protein